MKDKKLGEWPAWLPLRENLRELAPYGAPQISDVISMNTNENPFELPEKVVREMIESLPEVLHNLNRYPDRDALLLRKEIARYINDLYQTNFDLNNIWAANGSNEILQTLILACGQKGVLGFTPSYSMHPLISRVCGVKWIEGSREQDFSLDVKQALNQIISTSPSIVIVTTPNNPTGNSLDISELTQLASAAAKVGALLIVDEAYAEFSQEKSAITLIEEFPNVVVVRTMSKAFALAGARLGYFVANTKLVEVALITRLPYHLSSQTQAIAVIALRNYKLLQDQVDLLRRERVRVSDSLVRMGFTVNESDANFILFSGFKNGAQGGARAVWESLLEKKILVRDVGIPGYLRVTIGSTDENNQFLTAMAAHRP